MFQDLRYGLRLMVRRPGFAAVAVATLALGIGTTTAIFAVTDRVLLRPVPYADPERLAVIWETPAESPVADHVCVAAQPPRMAGAVADRGGDGRVPVARRHPGWQRSGTHSRRAAHRRSAAGTRCAAADWPAVSPRGRSLWRPPGGADQRRPLAPPLPAGSRHSRAHGSDRWRANGNHRRDAAGLRVSARRRAARPRAGGARGTVGAARDQSRDRSARRALPRGDRPLASRRVIRKRASRVQRHSGAD